MLDHNVFASFDDQKPRAADAPLRYVGALDRALNVKNLHTSGSHVPLVKQGTSDGDNENEVNNKRIKFDQTLGEPEKRFTKLLEEG